MKLISLGANKAPNVVLGMMRIAELADEQIRTLYDAARSSEVTFFDHADIYGGAHRCETRFAQALQLSSAERAEITIQSKAGIVPGSGYDSSYEHLLSAVEGSLRALNTDYLDVLLLHRPDALMEPEEVARAFDALYDAGKVRAFGVSNHTPRQIDRLQRWVQQPLIANQLQLSPGHAGIIADGVTANTDHGLPGANSDGGGVLDYCQLAGITVQAWSPLRGDHGFVLDRAAYPELNVVLDRLAAEYEVTPIAIITAWITRHPAGMQVVLGTTTPDRLVDAVAGSSLTLTRAQWYEIYTAAGNALP